ncbi:toprim domain-containing protein [Neisseria dentiae]|uniref:toprim domain-containing protein n=4 Tax=Neisseria dentiae TaxID=194197 RepID=UPI00359FDE35
MKPYDLSDLKAAAAGRWPEIHAALGIPPQYLNPRKHCPCPYCGGKDRYRYTDHQSSGAFICNQCTPQGGSGFDLLMLVFGYDFTTAAREVAALLGFSDGQTGQHQARAPLPPPTPAEPPQDKQAALLAVWNEARPLSGSPAALYLQTRGIPPAAFQTALNIRHCSALPLWATDTSGKPLLIGHFPAMLAAITTPSGQLQGLHKTYLHSVSGGAWQKLAACHPQTGEPSPAKKMQARHPAALKGAAVNLFPPDRQGRLIVAEGIETALAARALFGLPAAAALSAYGMAAFEWPPETLELFICADNDTSNTGRHAADTLAKRAITAGIKAQIWQPETAGFDALDELNRRKKTGSR